MKFSCDSCGRKYRIEDDKVRGKTLRMDCRKCGKKILIEGKKLFATTSERPPTARPPAASSPLSKGFYDQVSSPQVNVGGGLAVREPKHWHVEINNVAVGPIGRSEVARKIEMGAVRASSLCWREGFDDWRPLHTVAELASLLQPAKPPSPVRIRTASAPPPPPRSSRGRVTAPRPAAIGGRAGASAAIAMAPSPISVQPERESQPEPKPFSSVPAPLASLPPLVTDPPTASPAQPLDLGTDTNLDVRTMVDGHSPFSSPSLRSSEPIPFGQKKGPPVMLYLAGGAGGLFLMAIGIFIGVRLLAPEPPKAAPEDQPVQETPVLDQKAPDIEIPIEETVDPVDEIEDTTQAEKNTKAGSTIRSARSSTPKKTTTEPQLSEAEQKRLEEMSGGSGVKLSSSQTGSAGSSSGGGGKQLTESQIRGVVTKNYRNIQRCYERAIRGLNKVPAFRLDAKVQISGSGRVASISVTGNDVAGLKSCISGAVQSWRFPGTGASTETSIPFVFREVG